MKPLFTPTTLLVFSVVLSLTADDDPAESMPLVKIAASPVEGIACLVDTVRSFAPAPSPRLPHYPSS